MSFPFFHGTLTGHSADANICIGGIPAWVIYYNITDAAFSVWSLSHGSNKGWSSTGGVLAAGGLRAYTGGEVVASASDANQDGKGNQLAAGVTTSQGFTVDQAAAEIDDGDTVYFMVLFAESTATAANASYTNESHN